MVESLLPTLTPLKPSVKGFYGVRVSFTGYIVHVLPAGGGRPEGKKVVL